MQKFFVVGLSVTSVLISCHSVQRLDRLPASSSEITRPSAAQTASWAEPSRDNLSNSSYSVHASCIHSNFQYTACTPENGFFEEALRKRMRLGLVCSSEGGADKNFKEGFIQSNLHPACTLAVLNAYRNVPGSLLGSCASGAPVDSFDSGAKESSPTSEPTSTPKRGPIYPNRPACVSESLHLAIHNSLVTTSHCLDFDPKSVFSKYAAESKLQLNALSERNSAGIGQITNGWAKEIRGKWFHFNHLVRSKDPICKRAVETMQAALGDPKSSLSPCDLMKPPHNPLTNVFLGGLHYAYSRAQIAPLIAPIFGLIDRENERIFRRELDKVSDRAAELNSEASKLNREARSTNAENLRRIRSRLAELRSELKSLQVQRRQWLHKADQSRLQFISSSPESQKVLAELSLYAYNLGHGGLRNLLREFSRSGLAKGVTLENMAGPNGRFIEFLKQLPADHKAFQLEGTPSARRRQEILNYVHSTVKGAGSDSSIAFEMQRVNSIVQKTKAAGEGVKCSEY